MPLKSDDFEKLTTYDNFKMYFIISIAKLRYKGD